MLESFECDQYEFKFDTGEFGINKETAAEIKSLLKALTTNEE